MSENMYTFVDVLLRTCARVSIHVVMTTILICVHPSQPQLQTLKSTFKSSKELVQSWNIRLLESSPVTQYFLS